MRVAAIQLRSTTTIDQNIETVEKLVRKAASDGAEYIQTPEMSGILQANRAGLFSQIRVQETDGFVSAMSKLANELSVWLHIGSHAVKVDDELAANRAFVFSPDGELAGTYDKLHMFDVDLPNGESWRESKVYRPGDHAKLLQIGDAKIGLGICYDLRFPELFKSYASAGAHILTAPAAFTKQTGEAHWHTLLKARAIENGAFVIAAAQGGKHDDGRETFGHSLIVSPWGEVIAELEHDDPDVLIADLNLEEVGKARQRIPNLANGRKFVLQDATNF